MVIYELASKVTPTIINDSVCSGHKQQSLRMYKAKLNPPSNKCNIQ